MKPRFRLITLCLIFLITSCREVKRLDEQNSNEIAAIISDQTSEPIAAKGKSFPQKQWMNIFKTCLRGYTFSNAVYSGMSIKNTIGTIVSRKSHKILHFEPNLTHEDSLKIIKIGDTQELCKLSSEKDFDFNTILNPTINKITIDSVKIGFSNAKKKTITGGQWYEVETAEKPMQAFIESQGDNSQYVKALKEKRAAYVSGYICVTNFTADAKLDKSNLLAIYMKADSVGSNISLGGHFLLKKITEDSIRIECKNSIVPLIQFSEYAR